MVKKKMDKTAVIFKAEAKVPDRQVGAYMFSSICSHIIIILYIMSGTVRVYLCKDIELWFE